MRHHHQRHPIRPRVGGTRHARDLQYHSPSREDLRQRRDRPGALLRRRRAARDELQGQEGEVSIADGNHASENLNARRRPSPHEEPVMIDRRLLVSTLALTLAFTDCSNSKSSMAFSPSNPFASESALPYQAPPFDRIRNEHYQPALEEGMRVQIAEVEKI